MLLGWGRWVAEHRQEATGYIQEGGVKPVPAEAPGLPSLPACLWPGPWETWRREPGMRQGSSGQPRLSTTRRPLSPAMWEPLPGRSYCCPCGKRWPCSRELCGRGSTALATQPLLYCVFDGQSEGPSPPPAGA